jgi:hypothetical protein
MMANHEVPYVFQSGKYKGQTVEEIIFRDPSFIAKLLSYRKNDRVGNNSLYEHLDLMMGKFPETKMWCPVCKQRKIKYFLFLNSEDIYQTLVCCDNIDCKDHLRINHPNDYVLPLKLSSLLSFPQTRLRKSFISLLKKAIALKKIEPEKINAIFIGDGLKN